MKKLFRDFIGFISASRVPNLFVIVITQYLTAIFLIHDFPGFSRILWSEYFFLLVFSTVLIASGGYIINDYYDQKIDMINRPGRVIIGTKLSRRMAMFFHFLVSATGVGIGFFLDIKIGIIHLFSAFFLWFYSNYLRRITLIGNIVISILTGVTLLIVLVFFERSENLVYAYTLFSMAIVLIREVLKDIADVKGDAAFGCESIPVIFGVRSAKIFIYLVSAGSVGMLITFLIAVDSWFVRYYFMALAPVFIYFLYRLVIADTQRQYNYLIQFTNVIIFSGLLSMIFIKTWQ